jgi:serine/threonine-protein kinase
MALSHLTDRVGQVLQHRYRILAPIGTGASASVYLADDVTLRRRVAVKMLHAALAQDDAFLRRFRAEAQAAAALNHPHVMAVYDWGEEDVPFLVTEYLGGGSLRGMLDQGRRLSPAQALLVGLDACRGLDYAHRQGFVHRDIKPANLLFDEEARLRIADFGLARALAEAAWTEPHGAVLGTARYASPEQARGEVLTGRSDVYSLALVMIEAVTGEVPFSSDTTLGTLMARVERPIEVPDALGPLRAPLLAGGATRAADRPDAAELTRLLLLAAEQLDRPAPLVLAGAVVHDRDVVADRDPTVLLPGATTLPPTALAPNGLPPNAMGAAAVAAAGAPTAAVPSGQPQILPDGPAGPPPPGATRTHRRRWPWVLLATALVAAALGAGAWWYSSSRTPVHTVPQLVGTNVNNLTPTIAGDHWAVQRSTVARDGTAPGQILEQQPAAGSRLAEHGVLSLLVSTGPPPVGVPQDLAGKTLVGAQSELQADGLSLGNVTSSYDETRADGIVIGLAPGVPAQLPKGSKVPLVVSKGAKPRTIPSIPVGTPVAQATSQLESLGLVVSTTSKPSTTVKQGGVLQVIPAAGAQVPKGSTVQLVISSGPPMVKIPDSIKGKSAAQAAAILQQLGLSVSGTKGSPLGKVKSTNPGIGSTVQVGTAVELIMH